jgi:hypothetical protein
LLCLDDLVHHHAIRPDDHTEDLAIRHHDEIDASHDQMIERREEYQPDLIGESGEHSGSELHHLIELVTLGHFLVDRFPFMLRELPRAASGCLMKKR